MPAWLVDVFIIAVSWLALGFVVGVISGKCMKGRP